MACTSTHSPPVRTATIVVAVEMPILTTDLVPIGQCHSTDVECPSDTMVPLSLNQLKAGEVVQRMRGDADSLLGNIQGLLQYHTLSAVDGGHVLPSTILGNPKLVDVQRLSRAISENMSELVALSHREARDTMRDFGQARMLRHPYRHDHRVVDHHHHHHHHHHRAAAAAAAARRHPATPRDDPAQLVCHACNTRRTPKWRAGPAGPCTLCNVCGLLHAMRLRKQGRSRSKKVSASSSVS
ncbi:GATA zinc finger domain-containing protein 7 [Colletotrichum tanaceti]|uniref:GATA zinc finger domain-containing protein 7 n=1 Tax=Colletotrichum tanaceti TaxID=1306861 RepID=A0A4U6XEK1_9PEZI|nr:GATA zinc finger domain-containing protein 7 [Colletotrichum tanaceti]TKW53833.1 GATA zinc finger domain-containing protein 7 [Colletotrichum tanaceti]